MIHLVCPCCEGTFMSGHHVECTFLTDCPNDADATTLIWELQTELEAAREAINYATENILDYDDAEWAAWNAMPAVRAALGKDADGDD